MLNEQISYEKLMYFLIKFFERYFEKYETNKNKEVSTGLRNGQKS